MFEEILERLIRARDRGDIEVLTMSEVAVRMERGRDKDLPHPAVNTPFDSLAGVIAGGIPSDPRP
jgi:hypothetical protein